MQGGAWFALSCPTVGGGQGRWHSPGTRIQWNMFGKRWLSLPGFVRRPQRGGPLSLQRAWLGKMQGDDPTRMLLVGVTQAGGEGGERDRENVPLSQRQPASRSAPAVTRTGTPPENSHSCAPSGTFCGSCFPPHVVPWHLLPVGLSGTFFFSKSQETLA